MKKLLFIGILLSPSLLLGMDKQLVPAGTNKTEKGNDKQITPTGTEKTDKATATTTSVTALIRPILTNISTLGKHTFKVAANFRDIRQSAASLKPDFECLIDRQSESCNGLSCATLSKCVGTTLSDLLKVLYPFLEAIFGSVEPDGSVKPGSLFAIVDSAERIPGVIPASLYTKLKVESLLPKVDAVVSKLGKFRDDLPALTKNFHEAMAMLNGIVATLNPEMLVDTMPIKPLPPVKELESNEGLATELEEDIKALPAPESVPLIEYSKIL